MSQATSDSSSLGPSVDEGTALMRDPTRPVEFPANSDSYASPRATPKATPGADAASTPVTPTGTAYAGAAGSAYCSTPSIIATSPSPSTIGVFSPSYTGNPFSSCPEAVDKPTSHPFVNGGATSLDGIPYAYDVDPFLTGSSRCKPAKPLEKCMTLPKQSNQQIITALRQENDAYRAHIVLLQRRVDELESVARRNQLLLEEKDALLLQMRICDGDGETVGMKYELGHDAEELDQRAEFGTVCMRSGYDMSMEGEYQCS